MTLCIAWMDDYGIHLASDSRISRSNGQYSDVGIKTYEVPINIFQPNCDNIDVWTPIYSSQLGITFAGNSINSFIIKDTILEFLKKLQYVPGITELTLKNICDIVRKIHEEIVNSSADLFQDLNDTEFMLTGFCPKDSDIQAYHFYLIHNNGQYTSVFDKLFVDDCPFHMLGSGKDSAKNLFANGEHNYLVILQKTINNVLIPSVGGYIQYGYIDRNRKSFETFGVQYTVKDSNGCLDSKFIVRGTEHFTTLDNNGFNVAYKFIVPFDVTPYDEV